MTVDSVVGVLLLMYDINGILQCYLTLVITRTLNVNYIIEHVFCTNIPTLNKQGSRVTGEIVNRK